jgi:hypothetical protein
MADDGWTPVEEGSGSWDTVNDFGRAVTNAATFGMGNRAKAYIEYLKGNAPSYSEGVDQQAKASDVARERSPYASIAGDVYGSFAVPALGAENLALRTGAALAPTLGRAAPAVGRAVGYGATGVATGAAAGAGNTYSGNLPDYVGNAVLGGAFGGVLGGAGGAAFGRGPAVSSARVPNAAEQEAATDIAYKTFRGLPARYTPAAFADAGQDARVALRAAGHTDEATTLGGSPVPFRAVDKMENPTSAVNPVTGASRHISPADIDAARKLTTGERIQGLDPWQQSGAGIVRRGIDDFVLNPPPGAVVPGTEGAARQAGGIYKTARDLHAGTMRTEALDELIRNSGRTAGATYSGLNLRNELQKAVRTGLKEKKGESSFSRAGYNDAELAAFGRFSRGQGTVSNALGYADKLLGGGGGLGAAVAGGLGGHYLSGSEDDRASAIAKGVGTVGLGLGLRMIGNRRAAADINRMRDLIAQRNPLYASRAANAPMVPGAGSPRTAKAMRDALALELLKQQTRSTPTGAAASDWQ